MLYNLSHMYFCNQRLQKCNYNGDINLKTKTLPDVMQQTNIFTTYCYIGSILHPLLWTYNFSKLNMYIMFPKLSEQIFP